MTHVGAASADSWLVGSLLRRNTLEQCAENELDSGDHIEGHGE